jgi:cytoskeletal protein CcmA (bactofilin family)
MAMFDKHKGSKESSPTASEPRVSQPSPPSVSPAPAGSTDKVAMIGRGISISGDVTADSNLRVEGVIEGRSVQSSHDVEIAESGRVIAGITAKVIKIAGEVTGDISGSEKVMIARSGRVQGNVVAPRVQLEDGALFRGSIDMNPAPAADVKPVASKPAAVESSAKAPAAAASQGSETAIGGPRKDSGLTLKSG